MSCQFEKTPIHGLIVVTPRRFIDERGWFQEIYKSSEFKANGIVETFVQDNQSLSNKGTLRGMHFQKKPFVQGKLVKVIFGAAWTVVIDIRPNSCTFGQWFGLELTQENNKMLYLPPGFAHGFVALQDNTLFQYKCTAEYNKANEGGIVWNDPSLDIKWPISKVLVSPKDAVLPNFDQIKASL